MRLIDADELLKHKADHEMISTHVIYNAPTVEAEPVKRGAWLWNDRNGEFYCSECKNRMTPVEVEIYGGEVELAQPRYCGWCGSRNDAGDDGEAPRAERPLSESEPTHRNPEDANREDFGGELCTYRDATCAKSGKASAA